MSYTARSMFIRQKIKTRKGQTYVQHQLLKSFRTPLGPRQEVVLNLGVLDLPQEKWKALADCIERKINNQEELALFPKDVLLERLADHFSQIIIQNKINAQREQEDAWESEGEPKVSGDQHEAPKDYACVEKRNI